MDNNEIQKIHLNRSYFGILLPPLTWRHLENFSTNSLGVHLSSAAYDENDYIRDFEVLSRLKNE
jgi:hypothetical protein